MPDDRDGPYPTQPRRRIDLGRVLIGLALVIAGAIVVLALALMAVFAAASPSTEPVSARRPDHVGAPR